MPSTKTPDPITLDLDATHIVAVPEHLWTLADVAKFLRRCENTARAYIEAWDDAPEPLFSDGRGRVWDPRVWWAWAEHHNERKAKLENRRRAKDAGRAKGTKTRV